MQEAAYSYEQLTLFDECDLRQEDDTPVSSFGKTYPEPSRLTRDWIFEPCSKKSDRPQFQCLKVENGQTQGWQNCLSAKLHGVSLTLNTMYHSDVSVSFLSQILEPSEDVPEKYYLSAKACLGILRRAERRGKELPPELKTALEIQSSDYAQESQGVAKGL